MIEMPMLVWFLVCAVMGFTIGVVAGEVNFPWFVAVLVAIGVAVFLSLSGIVVIT